MWGSIVFGLVGAALAYYATTIKIRDQIDFFMNDMHTQGWWAAWAAVLAAVAVLLQALHYFISR